MGQPAGILSPRLACKIFLDGIYLINKAEDNPKYYQDRMPEVVLKFAKKKQFFIQCIEAGKRVLCRLAKGMGLKPNCIAEEIFIYAVLRDLAELGWRRIANEIENLPETEKDRDYARVQRLSGCDDIAVIYQTSNEVKPVPKQKSKATEERTVPFADANSWFNYYEANWINDHEILPSSE